MTEQLNIDFSGKTCSPSKDKKRLGNQLLKVLDFMTDFPGFHTLREISECTQQPEASVSARLRNIDKLPGYKKLRRREDSGLHEYAIVKVSS